MYIYNVLVRHYYILMIYILTKLQQNLHFNNIICLLFTDLHVDDNDLKNLCLIEIEKLMQVNGRSLKEFPCLP